MTQQETRVTLMLALNAYDWREDKARRLSRLVSEIAAAASHVLDVDGYEIQDTLIYVRMRGPFPPGRMRKLLREDEALIRLRARLGDLGARPEFEMEPDQ